MAISNVFKKAVEESDVLSIRIAMKDSLLQDVTFSQFKVMEGMVKHIPDVYEDHDGRTFEMNTSAWDIDYLDTIMAQLMMNFSKDRLDHAKRVVQKLYPATNADFQKAGKSNGASSHSSPKSSSNTETVIVASVGGAAVGAGVAAVTSSSVVAGAVTGAVVCGVLAAVLTGGRK